MGIVSVDPHVSFFVVLDLCFIDAHALDWRFVSVDDFAIIDLFMHTVIYKRKVFFSTLNDPIGHGICCQVYTIILESSCLSLDGKCIYILAINDGSNKSGSGNTVTEKIRWPFGFDNSSVVVL